MPTDRETFYITCSLNATVVHPTEDIPVLDDGQAVLCSTTDETEARAVVAGEEELSVRRLSELKRRERLRILSTIPFAEHETIQEPA